MKTPLVSVIVPVYNVEKYLKKCLDSILGQTYSNIEVILVDDGSTDGSGRICDECVKKDKRFRVVHQKNGGVAVARNTGLNKAKGELVCFVDPDDWIEYDYLGILVKTIIENNGDIAICGYYLVNEGDDILRRCNKKCSNRLFVYDQEEAMKELLYQKSIDNSLCWRIFKKNVLRNVVFPNGRIFEDYAVTYEILKNAHRILKINRQLYYYVQREDSIMHAPFSEKNFDILLFSKLLHDQVILERPNLKKAMISRIVSACFYLLRVVDKKKYKSQYYEIIKIIQKYRWQVLMDRNVKIKIKFGIIISYINVSLIPKIYNFGLVKRKIYMK